MARHACMAHSKFTRGRRSVGIELLANKGRVFPDEECPKWAKSSREVLRGAIVSLLFRSILAISPMGITFWRFFVIYVFFHGYKGEWRGECAIRTLRQFGLAASL